MNNMAAMIGQFQQFMQNPAAMLQRAGVPQQIASNPNQAIQYLMNSGKISQQQYNQAQSMARQLGPQFQQMFNAHPTQI